MARSANRRAWLRRAALLMALAAAACTDLNLSGGPGPTFPRETTPLTVPPPLRQGPARTP